jgi:uncharacterized protein YktA (UPF0223 family)
MDYQYPMAMDWTTEEIVDAIAFYDCVEKAYEKGVKRSELMAKYRRFKEIVPSKAEEKTLCSEFDRVSGYSCYRAVQQAKSLEDNDMVKM